MFSFALPLLFIDFLVLPLSILRFILNEFSSFPHQFWSCPSRFFALFSIVFLILFSSILRLGLHRLVALFCFHRFLPCSSQFFCFVRHRFFDLVLVKSSPCSHWFFVFSHKFFALFFSILPLFLIKFCLILVDFSPCSRWFFVFLHRILSCPSRFFLPSRRFFDLFSSILRLVFIESFRINFWLCLIDSSSFSHRFSCPSRFFCLVLVNSSSCFPSIFRFVLVNSSSCFHRFFVLSSSIFVLS